MLYSVKEYSETMLINGKLVSEKTIIRRIKKNQLPSNHKASKIGRNYLIEVVNDFKEIKW